MKAKENNSFNIHETAGWKIKRWSIFLGQDW